MGVSSDRKLAHWVDLVGDLLLSGSPRFPVEVLMAELCRTFGAHVSWNWSDADGSFGFQVHDVVPGYPPADALDRWSQAAYREHPLVKWYSTTLNLKPMTIGRVPQGFWNDTAKELIREDLAPFAVGQQLSIPYRISPAVQRSFVLGKAGSDFRSEDLRLASRLQPLLVLLARQHAVLAENFEPGAHTDTRPGSLTNRELSVVGLLSQGLTAAAIAGRLGISVRTAQVHLDHVYRKLGVHDRLMAVQVARQAGILAPTQALCPACLRGQPRQNSDQATPADRRYSWHPGVGSQHLAGTP